MKNAMERDNRRRWLVSKQELKRLWYKSLIQDHSLSQGERWRYIVKLNQLSRNASAVRVRRRCVLTGRARSTHRFCKLSRIRLRDLAGKGQLVGVSKASW